ncbi:uncharacterized protein PITG_09714 [Phytophthora infestans T30-4]|uniref:Uncharacterized protein n=1 Tax=Phytophthora infestans (strain T30-4) TaxID=403677 RepID=D0NCM8_PHYIT|nr:uncharacterized protein PITG_09714 [Phytophthora infestans T30-4]EEY55742.1 conserved hypothetical protein [Phytophthora infestans T30-4]|eukprot:XP_002903318.1 conserved hypothetical protein [Phytophthora infestans T30-4]
MASARYKYAASADQQQNEGCGLDGKRQTGEGAYLSAPQSETNDGEVKSIGELSVSTVVRRETMAEAEDTTRAARDNGTSTAEKVDAQLSDGIAQIRLTRRRERKQAKRKKMMNVRARQRSAEQQDAEEIQRVTVEQLTKRQRVAEVALNEVVGRKQQLNERKTASALRTARVSLVQRQKRAECDEELASTDNEVYCARFAIAGTQWMQYGDKLVDKAPVDYVEGIGGFLLDVIGVWRFKMSSAFGEKVTVDACIVSGCVEEFLLGVDFMKKYGAVMDFENSELRYRDEEQSVIIPFRTYDDIGGARVAIV